MDTQRINEVLDLIRENLADKKRQEKETQDLIAYEKSVYAEAVLSLALQHVPDFLHQVSNIEDLSNGRWRVVFVLPDCAPFYREIKFVVYGKDGQPERLEMYRSYHVVRWIPEYDGDGVVLDFHDLGKFDDLDQALICALDYGDNRADLERQKQEWKKRSDETEAIRQRPFCPLKSSADANYYCDLGKCAWFVTWRGHNQCALKVIATSQATTCPEA